jgi:deoxycytidine triphosphate deaminase
MILVDKDIDERIREKGELIDPKEYKKSNLNGVSYDLTIDVIYENSSNI